MTERKNLPSTHVEPEPVKPRILMITGSEHKVKQLQQQGVNIAMWPIEANPSEKDWQNTLENHPLQVHGFSPEFLALQKAKQIIESQTNPINSPVLTSDSVKLVKDGDKTTILEKPKTQEDAVVQILTQTGKDIIQKGVIVFWDGQQYKLGTVETTMTINDVSEEKIRKYVSDYWTKISKIPGSIPIMHQPTRQEFYQDGFSVKIKMFEDLGDEKPTWETEEKISIEKEGLPLVFDYINGFAPNLLEKMGIKED